MRKNICLAFLLSFLVITVFQARFYAEENRYAFYDISFSIPDWIACEKNEENDSIISFQFDQGTLFIMRSDAEIGVIPYVSLQNFASEVLSDYTTIKTWLLDFQGRPAVKKDFTFVSDGSNAVGSMFFFPVGRMIYTVSVACLEDAQYTYSDLIYMLLLSINTDSNDYTDVIVSDSEPESLEVQEESPSVSEVEPETGQNSATIGEKNALRSALDYLDFSAFSRDGLIRQLEYEGYSNSEAVYAVDNCNADWNEQAYLSAMEYLEYSSFSKQGLIDQLEYEGFTSEQAQYGADKAFQ